MLSITLGTVLALATGDGNARATIDSAVARMGGLAALSAIHSARVEMVTEWQRTTLDGRAHPVVLSYEWSTELRDYAAPAWRYTRRFLANGSTAWREIVDLVVDSVALIRNNGVWAPQNVAYVDERHEQFTFAPERLMLLASRAENARALGDTAVLATRYARVRATVGGFPVTLHFARTDGALAFVTFRAAQPRDFGLAPWGEMDVALWYSRWQRFADGNVTLPTQVDVYRVGRPYKRMTTLALQLNVATPADSFAVPDSLRAAFVAQHNRAMFDLPLDSAKIVDGRFAVFSTPGTPAGAVKLGDRWLLVEAGTAPLSAERSGAYLARVDPGTSLGGAIVTAPSGQGGLAWLTDQALPTWIAAGAQPYAEAVLRGWSKANRTKAVVADTWLRVGGDSARLETIDVPDYPRTAVLYVPSLHWAYAWPAASPAVLDRVAAHVRRRGWVVERIGSARSFVGVPAPGL